MRQLFYYTTEQLPHEVTKSIPSMSFKIVARNRVKATVLLHYRTVASQGYKKYSKLDCQLDCQLETQKAAQKAASIWILFFNAN